MKRPTVLTIAGSDSSGGAGIQADIKTMIMNGVYAMSAVTALTAQNTTGVRAILEVSPEFLQQQLDAVFEDIYPDAIKIGMVPSGQLIRVIVDRLRHYGAKKIVVDPVMVSTSGSVLMKEEARAILEEQLLPMAAVITPNIPEAEVLTGRKIRNREDMEAAALHLGIRGIRAVLLKGGHSVSDADDLLYANGRLTWFPGRRIQNPNTHGTGCTLSSAIASALARGMSMEDAVRKAKDYISGALESDLDLGKGSGPLDHGYRMI
nr:bifunctional hydroxymethylpyrimidine kinase/phosphomethylpyrimidine kinase [uncultured Blautia sp.]